MGRKQLKRDIEREALARMEAAARTEDDFKAVVKEWGRLDANRERKERYYEVGRVSEQMLYWSGGKDGMMRTGFDNVIPCSLGLALWKMILRGDFVDAIFACPYEMHELVEDRDVSTILVDLSDNYREVLWYSAVRLYSTVRIGQLRGQTDRNIRKARALLLKKLRNKLAPLLEQRAKSGQPSLTLDMLAFLAWQTGQKSAALDEKNSK